MTLIDRATPVLRLTNRLEVAFARRLGWSMGSLITRTDVAVLDVVGATSGGGRSVIVAVVVLSDGFLIAGGAAGRKAVPDWVHNLRACPTVTVTVERRSTSCSAREPVGPERELCRAQLVERWPQVVKYEKKSERPLPIFVLEPVART